VHHLQQELGVNCTQVKADYQLAGGFNGGTLASAWTAGASHLPASGGVRGMRVSERLHPHTRRKGAASGRCAGVLAVRTNIHSLGES
jgi:hypothetical protein